MNVSTRLVLGALVLGLVISAPASFAMQDDGFNQMLAKKHTSSTMPDNCDPDNPDDDGGCGGGGGHDNDNGNGGPDDTHDDGGCGGGGSDGGYSGGSDPDGSGGGLPF
ncbi:hypothetical protein KBA41_01410 [Candidatus Ozemobacteraceae bacterium]|nr:hypothetical protein [Candidatus Ozemobacteraceae bacterium]